MLSWTRTAATTLLSTALLVLALATAPAATADTADTVRVGATSTAVTAHAVPRAAHPRRTYAWCWRKRHRCYSAISVNMQTGRAFYVVNKTTQKAAVSTAARKCRAKASPGSCRKAGWVSNGYLAVYYRQVNGVAQEWASGLGFNEVPAKKRARNRLVGPGTRKVWTWVGTDRSRSYRTRGSEAWGQW